MSNLGKQFGNVYDLGASRKVKALTGQSKAIGVSGPASKDFEAHADQALSLVNAPQKKKTAFTKAMTFLGFID